ncbi:MAG: 7TM diverse intracellular signaling domain-containing protein, partial [Bdellovibrionota bacterium]|nr:7TM diverse intracellular signaling domain-containing protein [Bdellovibrionota bacterium]
CIRFLFIFIFLYDVCLGMPTAQQGIIDLSQWEMDKNEKLELHGDWSFYWKQFIKPETILKKGLPPNPLSIKVPGEWSSSIKDPKNPKKNFSLGHGTYVLRVKGLNVKGKIAFFVRYFATAYTFTIVQGDQIIPVFKLGQVGTTEETSIPTASQRMVEVSLKNADFTIVIQASNFHYRSGGFFGSPTLGKAKVLKEEFVKNNFRAFFLLGIMLIMSLYHFGLFSLRREDLGSLWFGLLCFNFFLRELAEKTFLMYFVEKSYFLFRLNSYIEYISMYLGVPIFIMFIYTLLKDYMHKKVIIFYGTSGILFSIYSLLNSPAVYTQKLGLNIYQGFIFTGLLYVIFNILRASIKNAQNARLLLLAVGISTFGVVYDLLITHKITDPPFITPYTFVAFIFLQSYILATNFARAYKTAEKLSKDLEKEVVIRTKEAVDAKERAEESEGNVSNLLNNMRQSVFTINSDGIVMTPVSRFTADIFGVNIEGENIFDHVYASIDKSSELFATIESSFNTSFDSDELQWDLSEDNLPRRVIYKENDEAEDKILKLAYNPLWNSDEYLERIMFVVEDITEIEKLEKEMNEQKTAASKNIQMLQEMASSNKEDLGMFFTNAIKLAGGAIESTKEYRSNIPEKENFPELEGLFRNLHTLKGNSRIFGLSLISTMVHHLETKVTEFKTFEKEETKPEFTTVDEFIQQLYGVQGQINDYMKVGQEVFDLHFTEDKKFKRELQQSLYLFDLLSQEAITHPLEKIEGSNFSEKVKSIKNRESFSDFFYQLKMCLHTTKGIARSIGEREMSDLVHSLETGLELFGQDADLTKEKFEEGILLPQKKVFQLGKELFFKAQMHKDRQSISHEAWVKIFSESFSLAKNIMVDKLDDHDIKIDLEALKITAKENNLDFIDRIVKKCFFVLEGGKLLDTSLLPYCREIWSYLALISSLDLNKNSNPEMMREVFKGFQENNLDLDQEGGLGKTVFISFLRSLKREETTPKMFFEIMEKFLQCPYNMAIKSFVPIDQFLDKLPGVLNDLEDNFSSESVDKTVTEEDQNIHTFFFTLKVFVETRHDSYLRQLEVLTLLRLYTEFESDTKEVVMPQMVEVLLDNFNQFKKTISYLQESEAPNELDKVFNQFDRLLDMPVKYSFVRFKSIVKELSQDLGKKVQFVLSGDQGSLHRDKLNLLLDSMIHLVRNSLDHGIEGPDIRVSKGKEEFGTLEIECSVKSEDLLEICVRDDGKGVSPEAVLKKALQQDIVSQEQVENMTDDEKISLIFLPNFSTKEVTTEVSGRGVGMDVVKKNLEAIGAELTLNNVPGKGTEFKIAIDHNAPLDKGKS